MGAGGSGKGFIARRWLKYMPGAGSGGAKDNLKEHAEKSMSMSIDERGLSNLKFDSVVDQLAAKGIKIEPVLDGTSALIPFRLTDIQGKTIPPIEWPEKLPPDIFAAVESLSHLVFSTPKNELPSYWRQVNPDLFKEEIPGYSPKSPGYVHEMSSDMSKTYFEAVLETGDPVFVDSTGSNYVKMESSIRAAQSKGYRVSLVFVFVNLTSNQIRNALRNRVVDPLVVADQWHRVRENYNRLKPLVDKSAVVFNSNDAADEKAYNSNAALVNSTIAEKSQGLYAGLRDLIAQQSPAELEHWDALLDW